VAKLIPSELFNPILSTVQSRHESGR
jgi:hypothetical protein